MTSRPRPDPGKESAKFKPTPPPTDRIKTENERNGRLQQRTPAVPPYGIHISTHSSWKACTPMGNAGKRHARMASGWRRRIEAMPDGGANEAGPPRACPHQHRVELLGRSRECTRRARLATGMLPAPVLVGAQMPRCPDPIRQRWPGPARSACVPNEVPRSTDRLSASVCVLGRRVRGSRPAPARSSVNRSWARKKRHGLAIQAIISGGPNLGEEGGARAPMRSGRSGRAFGPGDRRRGRTRSQENGISLKAEA